MKKLFLILAVFAVFAFTTDNNREPLDRGPDIEIVDNIIISDSHVTIINDAIPLAESTSSEDCCQWTTKCSGAGGEVQERWAQGVFGASSGGVEYRYRDAGGSWQGTGAGGAAEKCRQYQQ